MGEGHEDNFKFGSIMLQGGGFAWGASLAMNARPTFLITNTEKAFTKNQSYLPQLFPEVPCFKWDRENVPDDLIKDLDLLTCTPPCAGLSSLNNSKGSLARF